MTWNRIFVTLLFAWAMGIYAVGTVAAQQAPVAMEPRHLIVTVEAKHGKEVPLLIATKSWSTRDTIATK